MVDALRRAHRIATPDGVVVDLHPSELPAAVEVGDVVTGAVDSPDGMSRHAAAGEAIVTAVNEGLFTIECVAEFPFFTYADTIEDLREYIEANWRDACIDDATVSRTRALARHVPGARPRARERLILTVLRPR
jgi:hypothetical protein